MGVIPSRFRLFFTTVPVRVAIFASVVILAIGCGSPHVPKPPEERTYFFPTRKLPPQPVYGRLREVRPPQVIPPRSLPVVPGPAIEPVIHLELKDTPLEEVAKALADSYRYTSYCSSLIAKRRVSVNEIGTLDELATTIATRAEIRVIVDHEGKVVRFLRAQGSHSRSFTTSGETGSDGEALP